MWISEADAAAQMGYKPKTLRRYAQAGTVKIDYTRVNYKTYEYCQRSIDRHKMEKSTKTKATQQQAANA